MSRDDPSDPGSFPDLFSHPLLAFPLSVFPHGHKVMAVTLGIMSSHNHMERQKKGNFSLNVSFYQRRNFLGRNSLGDFPVNLVSQGCITGHYLSQSLAWSIKWPRIAYTNWVIVHIKVLNKPPAPNQIKHKTYFILGTFLYAKTAWPNPKRIIFTYKIIIWQQKGD